MSTEDLLKPRYKCIVDYPCAIHKVGDIIKTYESAMSYAVKIDVDIDYISEKICLSDYPAIFKKLEWHEERDIKDMPEYAKDLENDLIGKVYRVLERGLCIGFKDNLVHYKNCLPATEQEYLTYQQSKQSTLK
jgi:hypothetical protein